MNYEQIKEMTDMAVESFDGHIAVPVGIKPEFAREESGQWIAHVHELSSAKEYDASSFHLYPLLNENKIVVKTDGHDGTGPQTLVFYKIADSTRRATKTNGAFTERVCLVNRDGTDSFFPAPLPLPKFLKEGDSNQGVLVTRRYLRTDAIDDDGRVIFKEG